MQAEYGSFASSQEGPSRASYRRLGSKFRWDKQFLNLYYFISRA